MAELDLKLKTLLGNHIENALGYLGGNLSEARKKSIEYYLGDKLGTEIDGRSQVVSTDVSDTIESILPNLLRIFTARKNHELVGYCVLVVSQSLHYKDHIFANNDVVFVLPEYREGMTGYKLIKYAEDYCRENNVSLLNINTKVHLPFDSLMLGMNFELIERIYSKYLRG